MDHDRLFKQLLQTFFVEFLELFVPDVLAYIEPDSIEFLDKEVFTDVAGGDRHEVDLLVKCRFLGQDTCFLILTEAQARAQNNFGVRIFQYVARLMERYAMPVYPIALLSYDAPLRREPDEYIVEFPDLRVIAFRFRTIQLNQMNWRDFLKSPNPVAAALMAKMRIAPEDRPWVKLACLRMMVTLKLDKAKQALIRDFMDAYLRLNPAEVRVYDEGIKAIESPEREVVMEIVNEFEARGEVRGKVNLVLAQLSHRFGPPSPDLRDRVSQLSTANLDAMAMALFDFQSLANAEAWIATHH